MFALFPGYGRWDLSIFIYNSTQPLLAVAGVIRAHYLCSIFHQLSEDLWGSLLHGSIRDSPVSKNSSLSRCRADSFLVFVSVIPCFPKSFPMMTALGHLNVGLAYSGGP